jgi:hypothetical protein
MRIFKTLGLACLAISVTVLTGAPTASAESSSFVLCEQAELECEPENQWPNPTNVVTHTENAILLTKIGTLTCKLAVFEFSLFNELSESTAGHISSLHFDECSAGSVKCQISTSKTGGISFEHGENPLEALARLVPLGEEETTFTANCGLISCLYKAIDLEPTAHSSEEGELRLLVSNLTLERISGLCEQVLKLDVSEFTAVEENESGKLVSMLGLYIES